MTLLSAAANTAAFMAEVGKNGNKHARWDKICDRFATYCDHGAGALIAAFAGVVLMLIISAVSISRLVQPNKCSISTTAASTSVVPWKHRLFKNYTHTCVSSPCFLLLCFLEWLCKHLCICLVCYSVSKLSFFRLLNVMDPTIMWFDLSTVFIIIHILHGSHLFVSPYCTLLHY